METIKYANKKDLIECINIIWYNENDGIIGKYIIFNHWRELARDYLPVQHVWYASTDVSGNSFIKVYFWIDEKPFYEFYR